MCKNENRKKSILFIAGIALAVFVLCGVTVCAGEDDPDTAGLLQNAEADGKQSAEQDLSAAEEDGILPGNTADIQTENTAGMNTEETQQTEGNPQEQQPAEEGEDGQEQNLPSEGQTKPAEGAVNARPEGPAESDSPADTEEPAEGSILAGPEEPLKDLPEDLKEDLQADVSVPAAMTVRLLKASASGEAQGTAEQVVTETNTSTNISTTQNAGEDQTVSDPKAAQETKPVLNGFVEKSGKTYYYKNGKKYTGWLNLDGKKYFFDQKGVMKKGITTASVPVSQSVDAKYASAKPVSGHIYTILCAADSTYALDIVGGSYAANANVDIYKKNGTDAQVFLLTKEKDGTWRILNYKGMTLDVKGASKSKSANVQTYSWNGTGAQKFRIEENADGSVTFINSNSGLALDVSGGKMQNKQNVQQYLKNGTAAQKWVLLDLTKYDFGEDGVMRTGWQSADYKTLPSSTGKYECAKPVSGHTYMIVSAKDPAYALDIYGGSADRKANADIYKKNNTDAQAYTLVKQSDGTWQIRNFKGMVLDIAGGSKANAANLQTYTWNGTDAQKFELVENPDGSITFRNRKSGLVLDIAGGKMQNKQNVRQYSANGTAAQKWVLIDKEKYFFTDNGSMAVRWKKIDSTDYYFTSKGTVSTGMQAVAGDTYYFNSNGVKQTGLQKYGGKTYYFLENGKRASGKQQIGDTTYVLDQKTGELQYSIKTTSAGLLYKAPVSNGKIVCLDPGHTLRVPSGSEPLGPGSGSMKAKCTHGASGVSTGITETELNMMIALKLREELLRRGYSVILTREDNYTSISNVQRANVANTIGADAYVRIHANSDGSGARGAETLSITSSNPYQRSMYAQCSRLARCVLDAYCRETGMRNRGVWYTDTMSGNNWSKVPTTIIEMGFMSNGTEDRWMVNADNQVIMVRGIANGIDDFFR